MVERYKKNIGMLSLEENELLHQKRVCVIGCGGLGGYVIELLARLGVGYISAVDGDVFEESNLNRQILSKADTLGKSKALTAKERILSVNPLVTINPIVEMLNEANALSILQGHDIVVDALDNIDTRFILQDAANSLNIPMVHGAIAGWYGQITTILPGDAGLKSIYKNKNSHGVEKILGNPSFTPSLIASLQVSEVLKVLIGRGNLLRNKMLVINLLEHDYDIIEV